LGASRAQPHPAGFASFPAGHHRKRQIAQIATAIKQGCRRLTTVSKIIAGKFDRFARTNFDRF
jgi:hypothetical protein